MTREQAEAWVARRLAAWSRLDAAALAADYAEDCVVESPSAGTHTGRQAIEEVYRAWFKAFPDSEVERTDLLMDGDRIALIGTCQGTNSAGFMGLPATGKRFRFSAVFLYSMRGAEIVHEQRVYDFTGMLVQSGMLKAKPA